MNVRLDGITPGYTTRPKGLAAYNPPAKMKLHYARILDVFKDMAEADALPVGPRAVGYRLKERFPGEYAKEARKPVVNFEQVNNLLTRMTQAQAIPWQWVADGASVTHEPRGWTSPDEFLQDAHKLYERDRREDQPVVVEVYSEARESAGLIARICRERGVTSYSGGGSCGPGLAYKVARRALFRAIERGQSTRIVGIGDFDQPGIRNVMRPHIEHVAAFLYGTDRRNKHVVADEVDGEIVAMADTGVMVTFHLLALTPEMAADLVEDDEDVERIFDYIESGSHIWNRDLDWLDGVQKIELEALDPRALRDLVAGALDEVLDTDTLARISGEEAQEVQDIRARLTGGERR